MKKKKEEKEKIIEDLKERLSKAKLTILTSFSSLKTKELEELRDKLREKEIFFKVVKNTLLNLALKKSKIEIPLFILNLPLSLAFSQDELSASKIIYEFSKTKGLLKILGGIFEGKFIEPGQIKTWGALPSREELYARLISSLSLSRYRLINLLSFPGKNLTYILKNYLEKRS